MKKVCLTIMTVMLAACYEPQQNMIHHGESMPAVNLVLSDSTINWNTSNLKVGKRTMVFMFGPSCPYSRTQMQEILDDMDDFEDTQIIAVTISSFPQMLQFSDHYKLKKYQNIRVGLDYRHGFQKYFQIRTVPLIAIYGPDNKLQKLFNGLTPVRRLHS